MSKALPSWLRERLGGCLASEAPAQIVRDAREHGVEVRAVDVNHSEWDNTLERRADGGLALRLGLRQADGVHEDEARRLAAARGAGFASVEELATRAQLYGRPMRALADADAFRSMRDSLPPYGGGKMRPLDHRAALWARAPPAGKPRPYRFSPPRMRANWRRSKTRVLPK